MTAPIEMADFAATVTRPAFFPAATHPDPPQIPTGPWAPSTDPDLPVAVDPALAGWQPPTLDDLGLTGDPVAIAISVLDQLTPAQLAQVKARLTADERNALAQYEQPRPLKAVA